MEELRNEISVGDTVMLNSGLFGKVADITAECFVIEFGTKQRCKNTCFKNKRYLQKKNQIFLIKKLKQPKTRKRAEERFSWIRKEKESE